MILRKSILLVIDAHRRGVVNGILLGHFPPDLKGHTGSEEEVFSHFLVSLFPEIEVLRMDGITRVVRVCQNLIFFAAFSSLLAYAKSMVGRNAFGYYNVSLEVPLIAG